MEESAVPTPQDSQLDSDELFHLAVLDSQAARHDEAIRKLKEALSSAPDHAKARYLLGAEYAEIGLFDRAIEAMSRSVQLDPSLVTAHFQLGLVHYTMNNLTAAKASWQALDTAENVEALVSFKNALLETAAGQFNDAIANLEKGIALSPADSALQLDMRRVKSNVEKHLLTLPNGPDGKPAETVVGNHLLLSNYRQLSGKPE